MSIGQALTADLLGLKNIEILPKAGQVVNNLSRLFLFRIFKSSIINVFKYMLRSCEKVRPLKAAS